MTPIPPVEVRQVRPCSVCAFSEYELGCWKRCKANRVRGFQKPTCDDNYTPEELLVIIDQHNAGEVPLWLINEIASRYTKLKELNGTVSSKVDEIIEIRKSVYSDLWDVILERQQPRQEG